MKRHGERPILELAVVGGLLILGTGGLAFSAQQPAKPAPAAKPGSDSFPKLAALDRQKLERLLEALKTKNETDRQAKEAEITALGRGVVPSLVEAAHLKNKLQEPSLVSALDKLLAAEDLAYVRGLLKDPAPAIRAFAAVKLAKLKAPAADGTADRELVDLVAPLVSDSDPDVKFTAAITLAEQHRPEGFLVLIEALKTDDKARVARVEKTLPLLKGKEAYKMVQSEMQGKAKDPERRLLLLRAVGLVGDPASGPLVAESLDESSSKLQEATVNALRRVVDGAEPLEFATVFDLVKEVETWKQRLGHK
jgi:HEAT repeat protein